MKIWIVYDQDGEAMGAFKKKPTKKSLKKFYDLDDHGGEDIGNEIAEDILETLTSVELH